MGRQRIWTPNMGAAYHLAGLGAASYFDKVLSYSPLVYFPLNETSGSAAVNYGSLGTAANGTYTGPTLDNTPGPDGVYGAPLFDGTNDLVDIYTAAFDAAFDGNAGTALIWAKVYNAGVWSDNAYRFMLSLGESSTDRIHLFKGSSLESNQLSGLRRTASGPLVNQTAVTPTDWFCTAITWDTNDDEVRTFYAGSQYGSTLTGLAPWSGALTTNYTYIGAFITAMHYWYGWLSHMAAWDSALSPAAIANLSAI